MVLARSGIVGLAVTLLSTSAYAQSRIIEDPGQRFLQQEKRLREQRLLEQAPSQLNVPLPQAPAKGKKEACFSIKEIELKDAVLLAPVQLSALTSPYKGTCMGLGEINQLIHDVTNTYIEMGYVTTRAYIPPQNLKKGTLQLTIVPGKIEAIQLNDNNRKDRWRTATAMPLLTGELLNLKDIEQGLDQLNRVPSANATLQLWPGKETGGSIVRLTDAPRDDLRSYVTYDNFGQKNTGENRLRVGVEKDNLIGINDTYSLYYIGSHDTNALAFSASAPLGYWTFSVDSSYSEYYSLIDNAAELFGTTWNYNFTADRVVSRGPNTKTSVYGVLNPKESSRLINDINLEPQPLTVARLGVKHLWRQPTGVWNFEGTYSRGTGWLGATDDPAGLPSDAPKAQFNKFDGSINYFRPLSFARLRNSLIAQYSPDALYSSEQIFMGDSSTVRGFTGSEAAGDSGVYSRNELSFDFPKKLGEYLPGTLADNLEPYTFLDAGYAKLKAGEVNQTLAGAGGGLRFNYKRFSGDLAISAPVYGDNVDKDSIEAYVSITYKLF